MSIKDVLVGSTPAQRLYRGENLLWDRQSEDVRFWFSGEDAPIGTTIYERVQNLEYTKSKTVSYDSTNKMYLFRDGSYRTKSSEIQKYDFGNHWKLYFDIEIPTRKNNSKYFLDFGSVIEAKHAFGFKITLQESATKVGVNWKLTGNSSNPGIGLLDHSYIPKNESDYERLIGYFSIVDGGDGYDRLEVSINNVVNRYDVKIPQTSYSPHWNRPEFVIGGAVTESYSAYSNIHELKMVRLD